MKQSTVLRTVEVSFQHFGLAVLRTSKVQYLQYEHTYCCECAMQQSVCFINTYHLLQSCGYEITCRFGMSLALVTSFLLTFWFIFQGDRKYFQLGKPEICTKSHLFFANGVETSLHYFFPSSLWTVLDLYMSTQQCSW